MENATNTKHFIQPRTSIKSETPSVRAGQLTCLGLTYRENNLKNGVLSVLSLNGATREEIIRVCKFIIKTPIGGGTMEEFEDENEDDDEEDEV